MRKQIAMQIQRFHYSYTPKTDMGQIKFNCNWNWSVQNIFYKIANRHIYTYPESGYCTSPTGLHLIINLNCFPLAHSVNSVKNWIIRAGSSVR